MDQALGVITVVNEPGDQKDGAEHAMKRMSEGALVHIVGNKVEPTELTISTGQTVFFAVEKTKGGAFFVNFDKITAGRMIPN